MQASSIGTLTKLLKNAREQRILDNFKKKGQNHLFLKIEASFFFKENSINYIILILFEIIYFYKKNIFTNLSQV